MRFIAGSIVVLAGSLLWGAGAIAASWAYMAQGNLGYAQMATNGGMAVVAAGIVLLVLAHRAPRDSG